MRYNKLPHPKSFIWSQSPRTRCVTELEFFRYQKGNEMHTYVRAPCGLK